MQSFRAGAVLSAAADTLSPSTVCPGGKPRSPGAGWSRALGCSHQARSPCVTTEESKAKFYKTFIITVKCV